MRKSRFTEEQAELGVTVKEVIRKIGITEQTFCRWKQKYGGLNPSEVREPRQLKEESRRLKQMLQDVLSKKL